jgi:reactive intermediate/imine deaminase
MMELVAAAAAVLVAGAATQQAPARPQVEHIGKPTWTGERLPFSSAVRVGDILFMSGQIGDRPDGTQPEGIEAQALQTMENIGDVLESQGLGWTDVFKCTVMLDNIAEWAAFNRVYVTYFPDGNFPARSAFGADGLAHGALVEVECLAYAGKR